MPTYISLASSATMFPSPRFGGAIITSALTPEMVQQRLARPDLIVSALNPSHVSTIDAIKRRYDLELPLPSLAPGQRAPQVRLNPGDELFIVQATLPRLNEGETHNDETVAKAPISFLRWRVPVQVGAIRFPSHIPYSAFASVIDHAHSIALWQRGESHLQDIETLNAKYDREIAEMRDAAKAFHEKPLDYKFPTQEAFLDTYLEAADILYYALCHWYQVVSQYTDRCQYGEPKYEEDLFSNARYLFKHEAVVSLDSVVDTMLLKYARRAAGYPKDQEEERRLVAPLFPRTADLYATAV